MDWRGRGGYVVAPPSRHASGHPYQWVRGRDLETPLAEVPAPLRARLEPRPPVRPAGPVELAATSGGPGDRYAQAVLTEELARVATAPVGRRNRQLWESTRNLYNLVATGALNHRQVDRGLLAAAERCGILAEEPRQTHRTWPRAARSAWPTPAAPPSPPAPNPPMGRRRCGRSANQQPRGGERHGRRRPPDRLAVSMGWARAAAKQSPHPPRPPRRKEPAWAAIQP
jgi:hypothetical protein